MGILTVGIVTIPFNFEGKKRKEFAEDGIEEMRQSVDTLLVIKNEKLREMYGNLGVTQAFGKADNVLTTAAKGIAELISVHGEINVDMNDVITVMKDSGVAIMGTGLAEGPDRASIAVKEALDSPLLNENDIHGASDVLLNITFGTEDVTMDEVSEITDYIQDAAGDSANVIWGYGHDESLGNEIRVTIIATGFDGKMNSMLEEIEPEMKRIPLEPEEPKAITQKITSPISRDVEAKVTQEEEADEPFLRTINPSENPAPQAEMDFPSMKENKTEENIIRHTLDLEDEDDSIKAPLSMNNEPRIDRETFKRRTDERMNRLNNLTNPIHTGKNLREYENIPAYVRKNMNLDNTAHSSESQVSRFTLSQEEDEEGKKSTGIRPNNSFLHDNVD